MKPVYFQRILIIFLSVCIAFGTLELLARWYYSRWNAGLSVPFVLFYRTFPGSDDLRNAVRASALGGIVFELKPGISFSFYNRTIHTNSDGLVSLKEYSRAKPDGVYRIAGVGDSFMFPWDVSMDQTYLSLLEKKLSGVVGGKRIEVLNFSVPGYNTAIEYEVIRQKVLPYQPDLIIIGFAGNDLSLPNYIRDPVHVPSYAAFVLTQAAEYSLCRISSRLCPDSSAHSLSVEEYLAVNNRLPDQVNKVPQKYRYMIGRDNFLHAMKRIADVTTRKGIPVILASRADIILNAYDKYLRDLGFLYFPGDQYMTSYSYEHSVPEKKFIISGDDPHFSAYGHSVYADLLFQFIMEPDIRSKVGLP